MKIPAPVILAVVTFVALGASAQSLQMQNVNYPGIYCRFNATCQVSPTVQSGSYTPTNASATCVLASRTFPGASIDTQGLYGYEYQLTINSSGLATGTNIVTVNSLALNFGVAPNVFAFGDHASNQVWVVTIGGPAGLAPASAEMDETNVVINFDPPLTLDAQTDQTTNTLYFGMLAGGPPEMTKATLKGWVLDPENNKLPFNAKVDAQTP